MVCFLMVRRPPRSTRTDTHFPSTTRFRSAAADTHQQAAVDALHHRRQPPIGVDRAKHPTPRRPADVAHRPVGEPEVDDRRIARCPGNAIMLEASARTSSEQRRVGKECVRTCRSPWSPLHSKTKQPKKK